MPIDEFYGNSEIVTNAYNVPSMPNYPGIVLLAPHRGEM